MHGFIMTGQIFQSRFFNFSQEYNAIAPLLWIKCSTLKSWPYLLAVISMNKGYDGFQGETFHVVMQLCRNLSASLSRPL